MNGRLPRAGAARCVPTSFEVLPDERRWVGTGDLRNVGGGLPPSDRLLVNQ
ncbi:hypothetical protein HN018_23900 (plasmid) [Lichenicola cladoniae]|uniref:Uncharacterized protein n=1 Tax=Lichenicola cladoniae TaxID=1484109 RepID=A0A6M8HXU7_9PROT|nr:hypothetical protein [Lichenicola cladoniae]NPD69806.1 hypothetical protein [Acetobacteraceae bacterium]QKE93222.1 hypothetical protein HN018_23900 [Lichenicola cladoniae]